MKQKIQHFISSGKIVTVLAACVLLAVGSCKPNAVDTTTDGTKFQGTWTCTSACSTGTTYLDITAGYTNSSVLLSGTSVGFGSCKTAEIITMTANGSKLTIPNQSFTSSCGRVYTVYGSGSLDSTTLTIYEVVNDTPCTYTGHK